MSRIRVGVSACLVGDPVRYDGGHKFDPLLEELSAWLDYVPLCPEVGIGLGAPRPTIRLVGRPDAARLVSREGEDLTERMRAWSERTLDALARQDLHGFVLKKDSPTCGLMQVRLYDENGIPRRDGRGLFATLLAERFPHLPLEEEGRLRDPGLREHFLTRVFAHARFASVPQADPRALQAFHAEHKMLLLAHDPAGARDLGRLAAEGNAAAYAPRLHEALAKPATPARHANVLEHLLGHAKEMTREAREDLLSLVHDHRRGLVPLVVPVRLLAHHLRASGATWALAQRYLDPFPRALRLRTQLPRS